MEQHYRSLGWIFLIFGILTLIFGITYGALSPRIISGIETAAKNPAAYQRTAPPGAPAQPSPYPGVPTPATPPARPGAPTPAEAAQVAKSMVMVAVTVLIISGILWIINGWALLNRKPWARILTIILSILSLLSFPIGTIVGIYGLWAMFQSRDPNAWDRYVGALPAEGGPTV